MRTIKPAFDDNDNCIFLCADDNYMALTAVAIESMLENRNPNSKYDIICVHSGISSGHFEAYERMFSGHANFSVRFFDISEHISGYSFYVKNRTNFSQEAYYRLFAPWFLDKSYRRALYLDGDMIIRHDIMSVFETDLGDCIIAAVRDYLGTCNCYIHGDDRREYRESLGLYDIDDYVISATILFDLDAMRELYTLDKVLELCAEKDWLQHDQDVLNVLCYRKIKIISPDWGMVYDFGNNHYLPDYLQKELSDVKDPLVYHFASVRKPYYVFRPNETYNSEFWTIAAHTEYFCDLYKKCKMLAIKLFARATIEKASIREKEGVFADIIHKNLANCTIGHAYTIYSIIKIKNNRLHLEGKVVTDDTNLKTPICIQLSVNGELVDVDSQFTENVIAGDTKTDYFRGECYSVEYLLDNRSDSYNISVMAKTDDRELYAYGNEQNKSSPLTNIIKSSYYYSSGWIVKKEGVSLTVKKCTDKERRKQEKQFLSELKRVDRTSGIKALFIRPLARVLKRFVKKPIWLISDREIIADDNGKAFFRYVNSEMKKEIHSYFLISSKSPDYKKMKNYGKVVPLRSYRHKILALLADWVIFSQTDEVFCQPFGNYKYCYSDMLSNQLHAFLQHGIIVTDLSRWLRRSRQHFNGFVLTTKNEYKLISEGDYHYSEDELWLTGMARLDYREDKKEKVITVMPTWRKYLAEHENMETGFWKLKTDFEYSRYVITYRNLMHNEKLRSAAKKHGYTLQFKLHPSFANSIDRFGFDSDVNVATAETSYEQVFASSSLIVTDYSSVISDFIYLKKPIIYFQFDHEEFFGGNHLCKKGDFDYERDGFGEVEYDLDSVVDRIIEYMENDCRLKPEYLERIDNYFAFNDKNNCKRIVDKILNYKEKE